MTDETTATVTLQIISGIIIQPNAKKKTPKLPMKITYS